jgi:hypothetical protein
LSFVTNFAGRPGDYHHQRRGIEVSDTVRNGIDKTALSYWFPKLVEAGIPVPKTTIIKMPVEVQKVIWGWFDGKDDGNKTEAPFMNELIAAAHEMGTPCFQLDHFANVQSTQQLASLITTDAPGDAVIELGHNDSITIPGTTASYLQAHLQSLVHLH